jgi:hypothetical protein
MIHPIPTSSLLLLCPEPQNRRVHDTPAVLIPSQRWRASPALAMVWARLRRAQAEPAPEARLEAACQGDSRRRRANAGLARRRAAAKYRCNHSGRSHRRKRSADTGQP